jgi:tetratricopeptide (TPR) repeat protein
LDSIQKLRTGAPARPAGAGSRPALLRGTRLGLALVLVCAAAFRLAYLYAYAHDPILPDRMMLDASVYDGWAQRIAGGDLSGGEPFYFAPLYPYLLAVLYAIVGHDYLVVYAAQAGLGVLTLLLLHRLSERLYGARAALFAAGLGALYLPFAFFETKILGTSLGLFLSVLALDRLALACETAADAEDAAGKARRRGAALERPWPWIAAGAASGVLALCVPAALLLAGMSALWLAVQRRVRPALLLACGAALGIAPALLHNLALGDLLPVSGQGGITFYQGNNAQAGGLFMPPPGFTGSPEHQAEEERAIAEKETGRPLKRSEVSAHFLRKGLDFVFSSPFAWLRLEGRKAMALAGTYEASTEYSQYAEIERLPVARLPFLPYAAIIGLAVGGLCATLLERKGADHRDLEAPDDPAQAAGRRAVLLYAAWAALVPMLFYVSSRYRLPLVPALLLFAGALCDRMVAAARTSGGLDGTTTGGALAAVAVGLVSFFPLGRPVSPVEANVHYNIGSSLAAAGRDAEAVGEYDRCLAAWPTHAFALVNRGNSLEKLGRSDEALASFHRAREVKPELWIAWQSEGAALLRDKRQDDAAALFRDAAAAGVGGGDAWFSLGTVLQDQGRPGEAKEALQKAIAARPNDPRYHNTLGLTLQQSGDSAGAEAEFRRASAVARDYSKSRYNLGNLLFDRGALPEARAQLEEALRLEPGYLKARVRLGEVLVQTGDYDRARQEFNTALRVDPQNSGALAGLKRLPAGAAPSAPGESR